MKRVITLSSNVIEGYNATRINQQLATVLEEFDFPEGTSYAFGGEQEEQQESMAFLMRALLIALSLILLILVTQFNSVVKPAIILVSVLFSTIGVFGGIATFKMDFVVVMTGIGIVSLAGIVVNNAIVLIDYINRSRESGKSIDSACREASGKRFRPIILSTTTTFIGMIPLFLSGSSLFMPMAISLMFGLMIATILTLVIIPVVYSLFEKEKIEGEGLVEKEL